MGCTENTPRALQWVSIRGSSFATRPFGPGLIQLNPGYCAGIKHRYQLTRQFGAILKIHGSMDTHCRALNIIILFAIRFFALSWGVLKLCVAYQFVHSTLDKYA